MKLTITRALLLKVLPATILLGGVYLPFCRPSGCMAAPAASETRSLGDKKLLFIRLDFEDKPGEPISLTEVRGMMQQVSSYYTANSDGKLRIIPEVTPVLRLPHPAAWYERRADIKQSLRNDAHNAAQAAGYDTDSFQLEIAFCEQVGPNSIGSGLIGRKGIIMAGTGRFGTVAHELGHNFGLPHANSWQTDDGSIIGPGKGKEYGNPFDLMGPGAPTNQERALRHLSVWSKHTLHWLPDEAVGEVSASGTYRIFAHDMPGVSGLRALKIKKDGERTYWVEFRQLQSGQFALMNGALVYWVFNDLTPKAQSFLLDMTPDTAGAKDAPLLIGRTFSDAESGIHITPIGKGETTPESLDVVVNIGPFPGNAAPSVKVTADVRHVMRGQTINFKAAASDKDDETLAYSWECSDGTAGGNRASVSKSWTRKGIYRIRCTVSDMKGGVGTDIAEVVVE